jgi:2'-5' RNA ligase
MKRIFIAIDLSEEARSRVSQYISDLRDAFPGLRVGWERPEKLHLTLKFLGDVNDEQLGAVKNAVANAARQSPHFRLRLEGTGVFPSARKARILWLGLTERGDNLREIFNMIETELLENIGFEKEARKFNPHLTIARLREPERSRGLVDLHLASHFEPVEFEVTDVVVYHSELLPKGSVYKSVARENLPS